MAFDGDASSPAYRAIAVWVDTKCFGIGFQRALPLSLQQQHVRAYVPDSRIVAIERNGACRQIVQLPHRFLRKLRFQLDRKCSTTLGNSRSRPSPVVLTIRPPYSAILGSM